MTLPCKDCITYPICREKYFQYFRDVSEYSPMLKPMVMRIMMDRCSIIETYILLDKFKNAKNGLAKLFFKKVGASRCGKIHEFMIREIK